MDRYCFSVNRQKNGLRRDTSIHLSNHLSTYLPTYTHMFNYAPLGKAQGPPMEPCRGPVQTGEILWQALGYTAIEKGWLAFKEEEFSCGLRWRPHWLSFSDPFQPCSLTSRSESAVKPLTSINPIAPSKSSRSGACDGRKKGHVNSSNASPGAQPSAPGGRVGGAAARPWNRLGTRRRPQARVEATVVARRSEAQRHAARPPNLHAAPPVERTGAGAAAQPPESQAARGRAAGPSPCATPGPITHGPLPRRACRL